VNLLNSAARVRIGSCGNECHDMRCHRSTMVLWGRGSAPAAALSGSLFLKPPALPEDTYYGSYTACAHAPFPTSACAQRTIHTTLRVLPSNAHDKPEHGKLITAPQPQELRCSKKPIDHERTRRLTTSCYLPFQHLSFPTRKRLISVYSQKATPWGSVGWRASGIVKEGQQIITE
jgi:hypothetical protein